MSSSRTRGKMKLSTRKALVGFSFILPNFIGFFIFILIPVVFSFILSFMEWDGFNEMQFNGIKNFIAIFNERNFRSALSKTIIFTLVTTVLTLLASLGLAMLLNMKLKLTNFFRSAIFFPYVASIVSVAVVWKLLFMKDFGPINQFLQMLGVSDPPGWIASTQWALPAVMIVYVWKNMGYYMIVYLAALQDVPMELHEAACIDGATKLQRFFSVTVPTIMPATLFVIMMLIINSFKSFDLIFALTEGGPGIATTLLSNYIYNKAFVSFNYGHTSAAAFILFLIIGAITIFQFWIEKKLSD